MVWNTTNSNASTGKDRAQSSAIGFILILGFITITAATYGLLGVGIMNEIENTRHDANFETDTDIEINETNNTITSNTTIEYDTGDPFNAQNTEELRLTTHTNGTEVVLFNETNGLMTGKNLGKKELTEGMTVLTAEQADDAGIQRGQKIQFIWIPANTDSELELVADTVFS